MFILIVSYLNGNVEYYGPFPNKERTEAYAKVVDEQLKPRRWHIAELTIPYNVVRSINWWDGEPTRKSNFIEGR